MEKTLRKFAIALLAVIIFSCLSFAVACGAKKFYTITYICDEGVSIESEVKSGAQVKEGYEVSFTLVIDDNAFGDPTVTVNESVLRPDDKGVYTFKMKEDTVVEVTGVSLLDDYTVKFGMEVEVEVLNSFGEPVTTTALIESEWVRFSTLDGQPLSEITAASGETISFKLDISIYYGDCDYTVAAGSSILRPDENGVYTCSVTDNQNIAVKGLPDEEELKNNSFVGRMVKDSAGNEEHEGTGAQGNPFKIKTPYDLYYLSRIVQTDIGFASAYYVLENDIDLQGEQLYVIGDKPDDYSTSVFGGTFDGQGHTIKNYYITDTYHDYTNDVEIHLNYVGVFGYVMPITGSTGIYNLNLDNFTVTANGAASGKAIFVGGLAGFGLGVNISNCSVNGTIIADGDNGYFGYAGGIVGLQQSVYADDSTRYYSVIQSCSSNVDVNCDSGYIYSAGGIAGYQTSAEERTNAAILNCYSTGNVSGAIRTGGITGHVGPYASIKNCYSTGSVIARSSIQITAGDTEYHKAYAGGIAGYVEYGSIISNSFFTGTANARAVAGTAYAFIDGIAGGTDADGKDYIHTDGAVIFKCYSVANTVYNKVSAVDDNFIKTTIGWAKEDWKFNGDGRPVINQDAESKSFTVLVMVDSVSQARLDIVIDGSEDSDYYMPVSYWYYAALIAEDGNILPEFIGEGMRTYGYYFDENCTVKVPFGYIPTDDLTLYAKFVDYDDVAGTYYIENGQGKHFELTNDGYILYRDGAVRCESTYVYNGEYLVLLNTFFAIMNGETDTFYTFKAETTDGGLKIYSYEVYPETAPLNAVKVLDNFVYGTYYGTDGTQYSFNEDGTGSWNGVAITYTVSDGVITVLRNGASYQRVELTDGEIKTIGGVSVTLYDLFKGEWEGTANSTVYYSFDGKGGWSDGTNSGSYTYNTDGSITFNGKTAVYKDGFIEVDGETLYCVNSFVGTWVFSAQQPVYITLEGISADGYGTAVIDYSSGGVYEDLYYAATVVSGEIYLEIYNHYELYAVLCYNADNAAFNAEYLLVLGEIKTEEKTNVRFCLYDDFKGVWSGEGLTVEFNGYGHYNLGSTSEQLKQIGKISVGDNDFDGVYLNEDGTLKNSFEIGGKTYEMTYNADGTLTVNVDGNSYKLTKNS